MITVEKCNPYLGLRRLHKMASVVKVAARDHVQNYDRLYCECMAE